FKSSSAWYYNYLTLKDDKARISCVVHDSILKKLDFDIKDGREYIVYGQLSVYEKNGTYQLKLNKVERLGKGSLQEQLEKLKSKLQEEGLFAEEHKKSLPEFPEKIGVVASKSGAAWKDFKKVVKHRFEGVELILKDVLAQGKKCPEQVAQAVKDFNAEDEVDVIIVTRGGGSLEDLWGFNDEDVARAIFESIIPVVSAVGHEKDFTIADLVADHRSSTPSNAAEEIVPDKRDIMRRLDEFAGKIAQTKERFKDLPKQVDEIYQRVKSLFLQFISNKEREVEYIFKKVEAISPNAVLKRGYSVVYKKGTVVRSAGGVKINDDLKVKLAKGGIFARVRGKSAK
ncbi:MAG: Exodeoxyribonuclease 7 large subunit, partial [uncultured bacterium]